MEDSSRWIENRFVVITVKDVGEDSVLCVGWAGGWGRCFFHDLSPPRTDVDS